MLCVNLRHDVASTHACCASQYKMPTQYSTTIISMEYNTLLSGDVRPTTTSGKDHTTLCKLHKAVQSKQNKNV